MTTARAQMRSSAHPGTCRGRCTLAARYPSHHDRLLSVDTDAEALLELMELAVTWHELDYSETPVIAPEHWATFAQRHHWICPERAQRAFGLAEDIVGRRAERRVPPAPLADVIELVVG